MSKAINPFKPTAGMNPPELIGRDAVLDDFAEALENGPGAPDRLMRISGVRGTGKTVLLNALGDLARKKDSKSLTSPQIPVFAIEFSRLCNEMFVLNQCRFLRRF